MSETTRPRTERQLSLRRFLLGRLLAWLLPIVVLGMSVHWAVERALLLEVFEDRLVERARAVASLVVFEGGALSFDYVEDYMPEYSSRASDYFFEIRLPNGETLVRSPSLQGNSLPWGSGSPNAPHSLRSAGPENSPLVLVGVRFTEPVRTEVPDAPPFIDITLGARRDLLQATLRAGLIEVLLSGVVTTLAVVIAVVLTLRRGAAAISQVVDSVQGIDPAHPGRALALDQVPEEIRPIVHELNRSLATTARVMEQERSFNANVAHELRTPISEIRATTEIALRFPDQEEERIALQDAHDVAVRMGETVESLLQIARLQSNPSTDDGNSFDLAAVVRQAFTEALEQAQGDRTLQVSHEGPCFISRGTGAWTLAVDNLASNAMQHSPPGTCVLVSVVSTAESTTLTVTNDAPDLSHDDLPHLTERLWRGARSVHSGMHSGLGLSIVEAATRPLSGTLRFSLDGGRLTAKLEVPNDPDPDGADS